MTGMHGYYRELSYEQLCAMDTQLQLWLDIRQESPLKNAEVGEYYTSINGEMLRMYRIPYNGYNNSGWLNSALNVISGQSSLFEVELVVVCCDTGQKSLAAARLLQGAGINAVSLKGGISHLK